MIALNVMERTSLRSCIVTNELSLSHHVIGLDFESIHPGNKEFESVALVSCNSDFVSVALKIIFKVSPYPCRLPLLSLHCSPSKTLIGITVRRSIYMWATSFISFPLTSNSLHQNYMTSNEAIQLLLATRCKPAVCLLPISLLLILSYIFRSASSSSHQVHRIRSNSLGLYSLNMSIEPINLSFCIGPVR